MIGSIHIFVFIESSNQAANNLAQDVWVQHNEVNAGNIFTYVKGEEGVKEFTDFFQVKKYPSVLFVEELANRDFKSIVRIEGATTFQQIDQVFTSLLNGEFEKEREVGLDSRVGGDGTGGKKLKGEKSGFGLFGLFNVQLPKFGFPIFVILLLILVVIYLIFGRSFITKRALT